MRQFSLDEFILSDSWDSIRFLRIPQESVGFPRILQDFSGFLRFSRMLQDSWVLLSGALGTLHDSQGFNRIPEAFTRFLWIRKDSQGFSSILNIPNKSQRFPICVPKNSKKKQDSSGFLRFLRMLQDSVRFLKVPLWILEDFFWFLWILQDYWKVFEISGIPRTRQEASKQLIVNSQWGPTPVTSNH